MIASNRFSDYFSLGKTQAELDFVDVPVDTDLALFCDPFAFVVEKAPWFQECNALVYDFFSRLVGHVRSGHRDEAMRLLAHIGEANDAHFGFSRGRSAGLGIGRLKAEQLYERLEQSHAVKTGKLYDLSDCDLFIPGIGPDNISDMTINLIRDKLLEYTSVQCHQLGIPIRQVQGGYCWDASLETWVNRYAELPVAHGNRVILVPKAAVRYRLAIEHREYYQHYVLDYLQAEHLQAGSSLVELLKDGRRRVTKRSLKEEYPLDKDFLSEFSDANPGVLDRYKENALASSLALTDEFIEEAQRERKPVDIQSIIDGLCTIPGGMDDASRYHRAVIGALEAVFYPQLRNLVVEQEINEGRKRIDIVADNAQTKGFFGELNDLHRIFCPYILIECKNYTRDIGNPELDQLTGRFSRKRSQFGILVCRSIHDREWAVKSAQDVLSDGRGCIVVLEDTDVIQMLEYRKSGNYEAISNHMRSRLREVLF